MSIDARATPPAAPSDFEAQRVQSALYFVRFHEQIPQETAAMVLDHDDDWALIDGKIGIGVPVSRLAKRVHETIPSPYLVAVSRQEMADRGHRRLRQVGHAGERGGRRNGAIVAVRRMRGITVRSVAGGQSPTSVAVSWMLKRVDLAVRMIDAHMVLILLPIVGVVVFQPSWI